MPAALLTVKDLFQQFHHPLQLEWLTGKSGQTRPLVMKGHLSTSPTPIGPLNLIHPYCIQVLGPHEIFYLTDLDPQTRDQTLKTIFSEKTSLVIVSDGMSPPADFIRLAKATGIAVLRAMSGLEQVVAQIGSSLTGQLVDRQTLHGVFMNVMGVGVLLSGESAVGKSELALELITRNHQLIADDAPEFICIANDTLRGHCPALLRDFIEVRGLGILNIRAMFGENAIKTEERLNLIINLSRINSEQLNKLDRLHGSVASRNILGVTIPEILLPVAPGRNLAVLVEVAVRSYILNQSGYDALEDFSQRQRQQMDSPP